MTIYSLDVLLSQFGASLLFMSSSNCCFLPAYRFLKRQVRWSGIPLSWRIFQFVVIHTVKGLCVVNKAEVGVLLELPCFFDDPKDVGDLISSSSAFSKTSLYIWKFMVHIPLKPGLENFEHYLASVRNECSCALIGIYLCLFRHSITFWLECSIF